MVVWRITKGTHWPLLDHRSTKLQAGALPELQDSLLRIRIKRLHIQNIKIINQYKTF